MKKTVLPISFPAILQINVSINIVGNGGGSLVEALDCIRISDLSNGIRKKTVSKEDNQERCNNVEEEEDLGNDVLFISFKYDNEKN